MEGSEMSTPFDNASPKAVGRFLHHLKREFGLGTVLDANRLGILWNDSVEYGNRHDRPPRSYFARPHFSSAAQTQEAIASATESSVGADESESKTSSYLAASTNASCNEPTSITPSHE